MSMPSSAQIDALKMLYTEQHGRPCRGKDGRNASVLSSEHVKNDQKPVNTEHRT